MRPVLRYSLPAAVFVVLVVFLALGLTRDPRIVPSPLVGKPAPPFSMPQLRDPDKTLTLADLGGKVALLNVWATWCGACREEHPMLLQIARSGAVPIYGLDYKDDRAEAIAWLDRTGDPYVASGFDPQGRVGLDYGVYGAPETFVIDAAGKVAYKHIGPITPAVWNDTLLPLVKSLGGGR
ncbi:MAG: DsbE family thiol:disulfide interchange protein [Gammaproteobacteria bacterium]